MKQKLANRTVCLHDSIGPDALSDTIRLISGAVRYTNRLLSPASILWPPQEVLELKDDERPLEKHPVLLQHFTIRFVFPSSGTSRSSSPFAARKIGPPALFFWRVSPCEQLIVGQREFEPSKIPWPLGVRDVAA